VQTVKRQWNLVPLLQPRATYVNLFTTSVTVIGTWATSLSHDVGQRQQKCLLERQAFTKVQVILSWHQHRCSSMMVSAVVAVLCSTYMYLCEARRWNDAVTRVGDGLSVYLLSGLLTEKFMHGFSLNFRLGWYNIDTTAKQVAMVWACAAKRRHWLGEEMYGIWGGGLQTKW